ncbi:MAG: hypothetical protein GF399_00920 [Candidatus Coatesbacteria bacterium]|nr:hypothetical protein [Candidatus Coatesbacteria bacterium]
MLILSPLTAAALPSLAAAHVIDDDIVPALDDDGRLHQIDGTTWDELAPPSVEARLPAPPPLASGFVYDAATAVLEPLVLAADNRIYGLIDGGWQSAELETAAAGIRRFDHYHHRTTGFLLLLGLDEAGRLYDNSSGELTPVDFPACPGTGPWEIELVRIEELDAFNVICLDSVGRLYLVDGDDWIPLAGPFSETAED